MFPVASPDEDEQEFLRKDKDDYPHCSHSISSSQKCSFNSQEGKFLCETIRNVFRTCPGERPTKIYTSRKEHDEAGSSGRGSSEEPFPDPFGLMKDIFGPDAGGMNDTFEDFSRQHRSLDIDKIIASQQEAKKKMREAQRQRQQREEEQRLLRPKQGFSFGFGKSLDAPAPGEQRPIPSQHEGGGFFDFWGNSNKQSSQSEQKPPNVNNKKSPPGGRISGRPEDL